ncbi:MAG: hypothetical protein R8N50_02650 [Alphaproteobacteria bacterium]|nr:hypothetical protein [Alphaproteobacteria bacterium]
MASTTGTKKWWMVGTAAGVVVAVGLLFGVKSCSKNKEDHENMWNEINNSANKTEQLEGRVDSVDSRCDDLERNDRVLYASIKSNASNDSIRSQAIRDSIEVLKGRLEELEDCCAKKAAKKPSKPAGGNRVVREEVPSAAGNPDCGCQGVAMNGSSNDGTIIVSGASNNADTNSDCGGGTVVLNDGSVNNGVIVVGDCGAANVEPQKKYSEIRFTTKFYGTTR